MRLCSYYYLARLQFSCLLITSIVCNVATPQYLKVGLWFPWSFLLLFINSGWWIYFQGLFCYRLLLLSLYICHGRNCTSWAAFDGSVCIVYPFEQYENESEALARIFWCGFRILDVEFQCIVLGNLCVFVLVQSRSTVSVIHGKETRTGYGILRYHTITM